MASDFEEPGLPTTKMGSWEETGNLSFLGKDRWGKQKKKTRGRDEYLVGQADENHEEVLTKALVQGDTRALHAVAGQLREATLHGHDVLVEVRL